jgi:hypothetical protein
VIRRHVLAALATGVEAGDDDAARAALGQTEWVLRGSARRRLERALIDASLLTRPATADPDAARHVQRVAALAIARRDDVDVNDRERVTAAYHTLPVAYPPRTPVATLLAGAAVVAFTALIAWTVVTLREPHRDRPSPPPVAGAYRDGGVPTMDPALESLLAFDLAQLVVEIDADRHGRGTRTRKIDELRDAPAILAFGPTLSAEWRDMLDAFDRWVDIPRGTHGFRAAEAEIRAKVHAVSDQFAALGLGYYLEGRVLVDRGVAHATIFVYGVEQVVFVRAGRDLRRVLSLRRLDRINVEHPLLGMQSEELGDPVLLLDQIDEFVADRVLPVVGGGPYRLGDDEWRTTASGRRLADAAGDAIRRELEHEATGADVRDLVVATVRRHEARHGVDNDRDTPLRTPRELAPFLGKSADGESRRFALRTRAELAAYTSQIANDRATPQLALWNLASQAFHHERWGSPESYVAVVVIEGLGRQLGIAPPHPAVTGGHLDRTALAAIGASLTAVSDDDLRRAARGLWSELYDEPLLPIVEPVVLEPMLVPHRTSIPRT